VGWITWALTNIGSDFLNEGAKKYYESAIARRRHPAR
jgi:hypothetical protein